MDPKPPHHPDRNIPIAAGARKGIGTGATTAGAAADLGGPAAITYPARIPAADFFSGLGGFSLGARLAGCRVLFAANHWAAACTWHAANHPDTHHEQQDLQQLDMRLLPELSQGLLLAAPECQGHSTNSQPARAGRGGSHPPDAGRQRQRTVLQRSTAWAVVSAAEIARPRAVVVENVPELQRWELFGAWIAALEALGYQVRTHVLDARRYGSPQQRRRCFVTASLGAPIDLAPEWGELSRRLGDCLDLAEHPDHRWNLIDWKPARMVERMRRAQDQAGRRCVWNNVSESRGRPLDGLAPTLTTKSGGQLYLLDGDRGRLLNPRELARLQGFPDDYQLPRQRTLASHLIGNAVPVELSHGVVAQVVDQIAA